MFLSKDVLDMLHRKIAGGPENVIKFRSVPNTPDIYQWRVNNYIESGLPLLFWRSPVATLYVLADCRSISQQWAFVISSSLLWRTLLFTLLTVEALDSDVHSWSASVFLTDATLYFADCQSISQQCAFVISSSLVWRTVLYVLPTVAVEALFSIVHTVIRSR